MPRCHVIGEEAVQRYYEILDLCVSAELVRQYNAAGAGPG